MDELVHVKFSRKSIKFNRMVQVLQSKIVISQ
jgi:hypothetical protein